MSPSRNEGAAEPPARIAWVHCGPVFGLPLSLEEAVTERVPPRRKVWETIGRPKLLLRNYRMGLKSNLNNRARDCVRPALLPEDLPFLGRTWAEVDAAAPGLLPWLRGGFFAVMGGFMSATGVLTVFVVMNAARHDRRATGTSSRSRRLVIRRNDERY